MTKICSDSEGKANWILALHSTSETFGIAVSDLKDPEKHLRSSSFVIGRKLSNNFLECIEELLPSKEWRHIVRLGVAIGPGGFTSTRITVAVARTLAQQIGCPLDGISSFELMAARLSKKLSSSEISRPFWIVRNLVRHGLIAGCYKLEKQAKIKTLIKVIELVAPQIIKSDISNQTCLDAYDDIENDVIRLLEVSLAKQENGLTNHWSKVLPIYPTSPVGNI